MKRLSENVAIVTGGALGIGRATCKRLAEEGARVAITDIDEDHGREVEREITEQGGTSAFWPLDTSDPDRVKAVLADVRERFGGIDTLVNNAGIAGPNLPTHELTTEQFEKVMTVNVTGVFQCTREAIPHMLRAGGGSIINLSSIYGIIGAGDIPPYHASKGAVRLMTKNDALIYAKDGIRVNSVHPGFIWTPLVEKLMAEQGDIEEGRRQLDARHPVGHVGEPLDIANAILFLASSESKFITGSELVVDGGYTAQ